MNPENLTTSERSSNSLPKLSVIITSTCGQSYLSSCLEALREQMEGVEVIVVPPASHGIADSIRQQYPTIRFLELEDRLSIPQARYRAMRLCRAPIVAFTKDICTAGPEWCRQLIQLHDKNPEPVIGGAVEFGSVDNGLNWAAFFCEYTPFLPPLLRSDDVAMNNASYKRALCEQFSDLFQAGVWETLIHWEMLQRKVRFLASAGLLVQYRKIYTFTEFLAQRYYFSRSFAAMRARSATKWRKTLWLLGSPALPALLAVRMARRLIPLKQYRNKFFESLFWLLPFLASGAWGEFRGYLQGEGDSVLKVK